ncbi:MAG TPA: glycosyltransferase family 39 protein [Candidatus Levybacteria bacterium]|nr:glycosyltransferase family 39 protein [Candidatus Levybacteria bacterium]
MEKMENFFPFKTAGLSRVMQILKKNISILSILLIAGFIRLYRIGDYMTFLGDEGRDMLVVKAILEGDLTFLGPRASAGDFFLGPFYYYFITPFLWIFNYDPVGPAVMVALFGIATVYLVFWMGRKFFGETAGLIAALLYAVAPVVVRYSSSSWNPNVVPFFTLLLFIVLYFAIKNKSIKFFGLVGIVLGILMQLHYLATFIAVIVALCVLVCIGFKKKSFSKLLKGYIFYYLSIFVGFLIAFSPFLAFEIRHGFPNIRTIFSFIFSPTLNTNEGDKMPFLSIVGDVFYRLVTQVLIFISPDSNLNSTVILAVYFLTILLIVASLYLLIRTKDEIFKKIIIIWFVVGIALFGFYKKPLYEYYFGFLFPVPFLLIGNLLSTMFRSARTNVLLKISAVFIIITMVVINVSQLHIWREPNRQKQQMKTIAEFVLSKTDNKPFNFALITPGNSDHAYRYFFELSNKSPITIENEVVDPKRITVTDQLLIVCEQECSPLGHSLWEIAGFGPAEIVGEWDVSVVKVYKLQSISQENAPQL